MELKDMKQGIYCLLGALLSFYVFAETSSSTSAKDSAPIQIAGVPPGFQFLLEKQTTAIDVFYGDVYITTTLATYTPSTVEFHNPDEVVSGLKNLVSPQQVSRNLTGEIDSHVGEVCNRDADTDCGVITPETVGVIFDEGRFRADLFINPNLLSVQPRDFNRYLPASSSGFSSINNLALLYSGEESGPVTTNLVGQSLFSVQEQRVISDWSYGGTDGSDTFNMSTLYWQMDKTDYQYQAGWFYTDSRYLSFMPSISLMGFRYSTSFKARTDLAFASGTQLQVYLPSRSRVNIFRDGKFISTGFYDPGNQLLDTSMLPDGAYDIELRIVDSAGREERVTRFYVKTQRLAPVDQDLYFFEGGDVQLVNYDNSFPESQSVPLIQGGYSHRLTEQLGLNVGGSVVDSHALSEVGLYYVRDFFDFEPKVMVGDNNTYGWALSGYARYQEWGAFYQGRRIWSGYDLNTAQSNEFQFYTPSLKQHTLGVSRTLLGGYLQFNYTTSQRDGESVADILTLMYGKPFDYNGHNLVFNSEVSKTDNDQLIMFSLVWNFSRHSVNHSLTASALQEESQYSPTSNLARLGYRGNWYYNEFRHNDMGLQWNAQIDQDKTELGLFNDIRGPYGSSEFGVNYYDNNQRVDQLTTSSTGAVLSTGQDVGSGYQYSGMLSTVVGGEGAEWGIGGRSNTQGAIVVNVQTDDESNSEGYDLFINDVNYAKVYANQKLVIPVVPYKSYTISLADKGSEFVSFDKTTQRATIYPGNVKALQWKAQTVGVLVGRVVRKLPSCFNDLDPNCWEPLVVARAKNVHGIASTDGDGYIQVEVFRSGKTFSMIKKGSECVVDYSRLEFTDGLAYAEEDLKCVEVDSLERE